MANGGMFVLRNFYVSFCQNFKGELLSRQQRAGHGHTRRGYVRIFNSLQTAPTHWRSSSWATDLHGKWIKNIDSYTHNMWIGSVKGHWYCNDHCSEQWSLLVVAFGQIRAESSKQFARKPTSRLFTPSQMMILIQIVTEGSHRISKNLLLLAPLKVKLQIFHFNWVVHNKDITT